MNITKGLDISITGVPNQIIPEDIVEASPKISTVAVLGRDYHGLRPSMMVAVVIM